MENLEEVQPVHMPSLFQTAMWRLKLNGLVDLSTVSDEELLQMITNEKLEITKRFFLNVYAIWRAITDGKDNQSYWLVQHLIFNANCLLFDTQVTQCDKFGHSQLLAFLFVDIENILMDDEESNTQITTIKAYIELLADKEIFPGNRTEIEIEKKNILNSEQNIPKNIIPFPYHIANI